jgi:hypothetical protein
MSRTKKILIGIGGLLVVALLATGLWWAATPTGVSLAQAPSPTAPAAPTDQGTASETTQADATLKDQWAAYQEAFLNAFAARLGVTVEKLNEAYLGAFGDTVDQAVKDGVLTQDQGTQMKNGAASKVEQGLPFGFFGGRGFKDPSFGKNGRGGLEVGRGGFGGFHGAMHLDSFAEALNMTEADLMTELQNGKTLSDIAKEKNVDLATLKTSVLSDLKANLNQAVLDSKITQETADQIYDQASTNFDAMVTQAWNQAGPMKQGRPMH